MELEVKTDAVIEVSELDGQKGALPPQPVLNPAYCTPYYQCTVLTNPPCDDSITHDQLTHPPTERKCSDVPFSAPIIVQPETSHVQVVSETNRLVEKTNTIYHLPNQISQSYQPGEKIIPQYQPQEQPHQQPVSLPKQIPQSYQLGEQIIPQYQTQEQPHQQPVSLQKQIPQSYQPGEQIIPVYQSQEHPHQQPVNLPNQAPQNYQLGEQTAPQYQTQEQPHQQPVNFPNQASQNYQLGEQTIPKYQTQEQPHQQPVNFPNQAPQNFQPGEKIIPQYHQTQEQPHQQPVVNYKPTEQIVNVQYQIKDQQPHTNQVLDQSTPKFQSRDQPLNYVNSDQLLQHQYKTQEQIHTLTNTALPVNYQSPSHTSHFTSQNDQLPSPYQARDQVPQYYQQTEQQFPPTQFQEQVPSQYQPREQTIQNSQVEHKVPNYQNQEPIPHHFQPIQHQIQEQPNLQHKTQEQPPVYHPPDQTTSQYHSHEQHTSQQLPIINQFAKDQHSSVHPASDQPLSYNQNAELTSAPFEPIHTEVPQACTLDLQALLSAPHSPQVIEQQRKMSCEDHQCLKDCQCQLLLVDNNASDSGVDACEHDQQEGNELEQAAVETEVAAAGSATEIVCEKRGLTVKRRSRPTGPKLTVLSAHEGLINCQLETSNKKTVTFRFNLDDTVPADVTNNLVREKLLPSAHAELITELLKDLVRQLKDTPEKLPILESAFTGSPVRKPRKDETSSKSVDEQPVSKPVPMRKISRFLVSPVVELNQVVAVENEDLHVNTDTLPSYHPSALNDGDEETKTELSSGAESVNSPAAQQSTPDTTVMPPPDTHPKLSHQNSLENNNAGAPGGPGPQTIADLQQKLVQLTSQPSELSIGGTPPSHPPTPHTQASYDSYMQTLQQKLASISQPLGPLSPQSTIHGLAGLAVAHVESMIPTPVDYELPLDDFHPLNTDEPIIINTLSQAVSIQIPHAEDSPAPLTPVGSLDMSSGLVMSAVPPVATQSHLLKTQMSVDSNVITAMEQRQNRMARNVPHAPDLHDLEQELSKIHGVVRPTPHLPQPALTSVPQPVNLLTTAAPSSDSLVPQDHMASDETSLSPKPPIRKVSRFSVSAVQEQPSPTHSSSSSTTERREERRGRFSVVTQESPNLNLLNVNSSQNSPSFFQPQPVRRITTAGLPLPLTRLRDESRLSRWPSEGHIKYTNDDADETQPLFDSGNEEIKALLIRHQMELEELQRRHREEVETLCRQLTSSHSFLPQGISGQGSLEGFSTAPQSPDTQSRPETPR